MDTKNKKNDESPILVKTNSFDINKCQNCQINNAAEYHTCPYEEEINGDDKTECNCCTDCEHECCMEI